MKINNIEMKKSSALDIDKGESYTVIDISKSKIVATSIKRETAKELVTTDANFQYGSSSFIYDKYLPFC